MAIVIQSPQFSFVNFNPPDNPCTGNPPPCLPVYDLSDLQFQVILTTKGIDLTGTNFYAACITIPGTPHDAYTNFEMEFLPVWAKVVSGVGPDPDVWYGYYQFNNTEALFTALPDGECFTITIYNEVFAGTNRYPLSTTSTCFYKVADPCYTSLLAFGNNSNAFGFDFLTIPLWVEKIRLPFYLHSPVNAEEEKSYAKSDGSTQKLMHRIWKDYKFKTGYLDDGTLEKLTIATACDTVTITNPYSGIEAWDFVRTEKVEIEWQEETIPLFTLGQAKGTLRLADPRAYVNSNCG